MKKYGKLIITALGVLLLVLVYFVLESYNLIPHKYYDAGDFGIVTVKSPKDVNNNGVDDFTDILLGAREEAKNKPKYKSTYYEGGYPPPEEGVCSDVIWRAFDYAGYNLKDMVDAHIAEHVELYPKVEGHPDPNIDFRRVANLKVFFDYNATSYTLDPDDIAQWQPGDIVIFGEKFRHIAIISDRRNKKGIPYIIHNSGQPNREEDALMDWANGIGITGHYRFE